MGFKAIKKLVLVTVVILILMRLFVKEYQYSDDPTVGFALMKLPSVHQTITDEYYGEPLANYAAQRFLTDENGTIGDGVFNKITSFYTIIALLILYLLLTGFIAKEQKQLT